MTAAANVLRYVQLAVFLAAAVMAAERWVIRRGAARAWLAATFGLLALVILAGEVLPEVPDTTAERWAQKALVLVLLLFPHFLYRFMATFERPPRALDTTAHALTGAVLVATLLVGRFPQPGEPRSAGFSLYVVLVLVQWTFLSGVVARRLWRAGRGQPTVARRRMRMLSSGAAALASGLVLTAAAPSGPASAVQIVVYLVAIASAVLFLLGFAPPRLLLRIWRARDIESLQGALVALAQATTSQEVVRDLLPRVVELVGAEAAAIYGDSGRLLGSTGARAGEASAGPTIEIIPGVRQVGSDHLRVEVPGGRLELWASAYTPYFGRDELELLRTVAALVHVTLERTNAYARELAALDALAEAQRIAKIGSWRLDVATGTIEASDEMYRLYGLEPQSTPLTRDYYAARVHPEDRESDVESRAIETGEDFSNEFRLVDDDGSIRWIHARGSAVRDESGNVVALLGTCQDVTDSRRLDQMRRDFVANAAHELRTPLTTVSGMATLLASQRDRLSDAELDNAFAALGRQGQRARHLVTSLLDLSRLEAGRVPVHVVPTDVRTVVGQALETAPAPDGVEVASDVDGELRVQADPDRLQEIVVNLLSNAYRYGGRRVRVTASPNGDGVVLAVADDGLGVPEAFVPEMFEPFSRAGSVTGTPGSGLGLAISRRLARAIGGDLTYEPNGSGARFVVRLRSVS